jgi:Uma2 family endonuclease
MTTMTGSSAALLTRADLERRRVRVGDDRNRYELLEGEIVVSSAPKIRHQGAVMELGVLLYHACPDHLQILAAPVDVVLDEHNVLQPDVLVIDPTLADERAMNGPPVLVVEVLSPSTRRRDLVVKKRVYERTGVGSYWVVDVADDEVTVTVHELRDGHYVEVAAVSGEEEWTAELPFPVTVVPARLRR